MVVENSIYIEAPSSVVWNVSIDIERWPQWTPTVTSVKRIDEGPFVCGSSAMIEQPGLPQANWVVTKLIPGEQFTWESRIRGLRMIATHTISTRDFGTESTLRVAMSGFMVWLLWPWLYFSSRRSLEWENRSLRAECEARTARQETRPEPPAVS
jgi:hypothetical protein